MIELYNTNSTKSSFILHICLGIIKGNPFILKFKLNLIQAKLDVYRAKQSRAFIVCATIIVHFLWFPVLGKW